MLTAALWGFVQGITEFLPVSSSGHLVLVPAIFGLEEPDLATTAVLHLGTLAAAVWYYRRDLAKAARFTSDADGRRILWLLIIGTIPAAIAGLTLDGPLEIVFEEPWIASIALIITGLILAASLALPIGRRRLEHGRWPDGLVVGMAQALALIPGISRSGMTITAGMAQGLTRVEAARYGFLLAVPAIAGAGFLEGLDLVRSGGFRAELLVGVAVAAVTGYVAISFMVGLLAKRGMAPFAIYCIAAGTAAYFLV